MALGQDQTVGLFLSLSLSISFSYYTFWVLVLPFVDHGNPINEFFPHRAYAVIIPALIFCTSVFLLGAIFSWILWRHHRSKLRND